MLPKTSESTKRWGGGGGGGEMCVLSYKVKLQIIAELQQGKSQRFIAEKFEVALAPSLLFNVYVK